MAVLKCKMCGGDIELTERLGVGVCAHCQSVSTFPTYTDEQRLASFNRGNHFRRIGEFEAATDIFEHLIAENDLDAEAHWCCALCRFGIEYVKGGSGAYIPTCHRAESDSILNDIDYLAAVKYADAETAEHYKAEASRIARIQQQILKASHDEEPFDVFICYKETDANGDRTPDSVLAQEIYYELTEKGYRVFFSRITLEQKAGYEYEPCIFAALRSAKIMLALGTKPEYFNSPWVKNEWSRFLAMAKNDRSKLLIPCYRDMSAGELPEHLKVLQGYDMSKLGFMQDLLRGIDKVIGYSAADKKQKHENDLKIYRLKNKIDAIDREIAENRKPPRQKAWAVLTLCTTAFMLLFPLVLAIIDIRLLETSEDKLTFTQSLWTASMALYILLGMYRLWEIHPLALLLFVAAAGAVIFAMIDLGKVRKLQAELDREYARLLAERTGLEEDIAALKMQ